MTFLFDWMSLLFMGFVFLISSLVILYSEDYMHGDLNIIRFIFLVLMFVASMMFLIISPNMIRILLGWDGLGLVSYCLVIYYQNVKSYNAGILTALSNRIGDVALLIVIAWIVNFGRWNYVFYLDFLNDSFEMGLISLLVVLAAMTKSAQIPFSSWLPAAIAAPTPPVSALVHSSTLVTAGVYLLIRFSAAFGDWLSSFLLLISGLTIFIAGVGANFEYDLRRIIALSTLSQLGLIIRIISVGFAGLAFFHLLTHALFKALLFICAGVIIQIMQTHGILSTSFIPGILFVCRPQWPRGLRRRSAVAWLLGLRFRIPLGAWMFVPCVYMLCCPV
jgi:NADH-ubiquinone oxidoreductase chain 5